MVINALKPEQLRACCPSEQLDFETTDDLEDLEDFIGQPRAVAAIDFGIGMKREGYHIFALGETGTGKYALIRRFLDRQAAGEPAPSDICYVNNFDEQHKPQILVLEAGTGKAFAAGVESLIEDVRNALRAAFESDDFQNRQQSVNQELQEKQQKAFEKLRTMAEERSLTPLRTPAGLVFAPARNGEIIPPDEVEKLTDEEKQALEKNAEELQQEAQKIFQKIPQWQREIREKQKQLNREATRYAVVPVIAELREQYEGNTAVIEHLDGMEKDLVDNAHILFQAEGGQGQPGEMQLPSLPAATGQAPGAESPALRRYRVNVIVDRSKAQGAPVVYEDNPTLQNLLGRVEHMAHMGSLVTDFNMIRAGSLHLANGGYLIVNALNILQQPFAWEGLKRALRSGYIKIESPGQMYSLISTVSLEPEPVPLDVKVILIGTPWLYYMLRHFDPEFDDLFKVGADFAQRMDRDPDNQIAYSRLIAGVVRKDELHPFSRDAVARVIEQSARMSGDNRKLSIHMQRLNDLLQESDYWAGQSGRAVVKAEDVQKAIDARIFRSDRLREAMQEQMQRDIILIDTEGERVGQVNGLSVIMLGDFAFGRPSRITASIRMGKGDVVDIEREVAMGGPIHSKGVLILAGFLGERFARQQPLSLSASLVFEQSYSGVEGDSASSAELYALLSSISGVPIKQSLAVTGSVNQMGRVQPIGGVNEKIEGFFDLCRSRGLSGDQGVLIPAGNVQHLMLREDVVDAVKRNAFSIFPVETVDQGIEILTGLPAGEPDAEGRYPADSINAKVAEGIAEMARRRKDFASDKTESMKD
ncbi:MAG: Lon protease family protein [Desulfobacterales bacterium]